MIEDQNPNPEIQNSGNEAKSNQVAFYKKASNPMVALFTMIFKVACAGSFLLLSIFISNDAVTMLIVLLLAAIDFWYTKNISGRILVGLRWWNVINPQSGEEKWIYESKNESKSLFNA